MKNKKPVVLLLMGELVILMLILVGRVIPGLFLDPRLLMAAKLAGFSLLLIAAALLFLYLIVERHWEAVSLFIFSLSIATPLYLWVFIKVPMVQALATVVMILLVFFGITSLRPAKPATALIAQPRVAKDIKEIKEGGDKILDELWDIKKIAEANNPPLPDQPVVGSRTGLKVHNPGCIIVERIPKDQRVTFKNLNEAIKQKYTACKVCMPGK